MALQTRTTKWSFPGNLRISLRERRAQAREDLNRAVARPDGDVAGLVAGACASRSGHCDELLALELLPVRAVSRPVSRSLGVGSRRRSRNGSATRTRLPPFRRFAADSRAATFMLSSIRHGHSSEGVFAIGPQCRNASLATDSCRPAAMATNSSMARPRLIERAAIKAARSDREKHADGSDEHDDAHPRRDVRYAGREHHEGPRLRTSSD